MEEEKYKFLNTLYKNIKIHDVEILKHFCDDKISIGDYFFYGINSDILSNTLNILINYLSGNIESAGVDNSCRTIIEAFVILKMDASGDISEKQKEIYKYSYSLVDFDNFHLFQKEGKFESKVIKRVQEDRNKAKKAIMEHFNCSEQDLLKKNISIDDPCFYLKKSLKDDIRFSKLLEKYPVHNEDSIKMYEFFSLFIHPRCEMNPQIEEALMSVRQLYIDNVIDLVYEYLKATKLLVVDAGTADFNGDFFYNPLLQNNVHNVKDVEFAFHMMMEKLCKLPGGVDWFTWHFLERTKYLLIDMMISLSLGYKEHVISCFKSFIENYAVFYCVGTAETQNDFDNMKRGFWISSRLQLDCHFYELGMKKPSMDEKEIVDIFNNYYKDKYHLTNYKKFYWDIRRNSLYALSDGKKSYNHLVKNLLESAFPDKNERDEAMTLYKISKDMSHASGYNFNASEGVVDVSCHNVLIHSYKMIMHFLLNATETLCEHGIEVSMKEIFDMFKLLLEMQYIGLHETIKNFTA